MAKQEIGWYKIALITKCSDHHLEPTSNTNSCKIKIAVQKILDNVLLKTKKEKGHKLKKNGLLFILQG